MRPDDSPTNPIIDQQWNAGRGYGFHLLEYPRPQRLRGGHGAHARKNTKASNEAVWQAVWIAGVTLSFVAMIGAVVIVIAGTWH